MQYRSTIVPGLCVDTDIYEAAASGLATHIPDRPRLSWREFTAPARWWLVPGPEDDGEGNPLPYKAECVLLETSALTIKINLWYRPDLRGAGDSRPHSHPWEVMEAHPVLAGYRDEHWHRTASGVVVPRGQVEQMPGTVNRIIARDYHEVTEIADPGRTVSVMICGRWLCDDADQGVWGHLDLDTGEHVPVQRDHVAQARFEARLARLNPQHAHP
jgi:hypothetical protein